VKILLIIALVLLLLLAGCIVTVRYIVNSAHHIIGLVEGLDDAIDAERWEEAQDIFSAAQKEWQRVEKRWKVLINHEDMRDIQLGFVHLSVVLDQQDRKEAAKELHTLRYYLSHVPDNERVELGNVL